MPFASCPRDGMRSPLQRSPTAGATQASFPRTPSATTLQLLPPSTKKMMCPWRSCFAALWEPSSSTTRQRWRVVKSSSESTRVLPPARRTLTINSCASLEEMKTKRTPTRRSQSRRHPPPRMRWRGPSRPSFAAWKAAASQTRATLQPSCVLRANT